MHTELASLHANGTWTLVERPSGARVLPTKWVLKIKRDATGAIEKFKARLVAKGFMQPDEVIHVQQPEGFEEGSPNTVCRLQKALYGLRQAPRAWHAKLKQELEGM
ncbi:integrase catalytic domain-containing protein, partial [Haematococcus lacustris]